MSSSTISSDLPSPSTLVSLSQDYGLPKPTEAFFAASDGVKLRYAHWQTVDLPRKGVLLFLNGRTEFIEKYVESYADLVRGGLDLWTLDWRGQGLSARALTDSHKGHIDDYQTYLNDLDRFVREVTDLTATEGPVFLLAHSMGGHIGLRFLHDHPGLFERAVLLAPMIDIPVHRLPIRWLNRTIKQLGFGESYALGTGRFEQIFNNPGDPGDNGTAEDYLTLLAKYEGLSQDPARRAILEAMVRTNPALALGGPTSGWLDATFQSILVTMAPGYAENIETPTLFLGGSRDRIVANLAIEAVAARLPEGTFRLLADGAHELLLENDDLRQAVFQAFSDWTGAEIKTSSGDRSSA